MGKILVIQPHRMLQQALVLALFPDHEVEIAESIPGPSGVKDFDAVIVDAASLGETSGTAAEGFRAVQSWKVPTIWVEGARAAPTPRREKLVCIQRPLDKNALQSALAECLGLASGAKRNATATPPREESRSAERARPKAQGTAVASESDEARVIELVDVVEESPARKTEPNEQLKKK